MAQKHSNPPPPATGRPPPPPNPPSVVDVERLTKDRDAMQRVAIRAMQERDELLAALKEAMYSNSTELAQRLATEAIANVENSAGFEFQNVGFTCDKVKGGVIWKVWPEDMADGTQLYTHLAIANAEGKK